MTRNLTQIVDQAVTRKTVFGVSLSTFGPDDQVVHVVGGDRHHPLTGRTTHDLGTLAEVVATTPRLLQLLVTGRLHLGDGVGQLLGLTGFQDVTVAMLMTHRGGLPSMTPSMGKMTRAQVVGLAASMPGRRQPGSVTHYSGLDYVVLERIVDVIDGSLERSVQSNVLMPLVLNATGYHTGDHAQLYGTLDDLTAYTRLLAGTQAVPALPTRTFAMLRQSDIGGRTLGWSRWSHGEQYWFASGAGNIIAFDRARQAGMICLVDPRDATQRNQVTDALQYQLLSEFFGTN